MIIIGGCREILGSATLFAHASLLLGDGFAFLETALIPHYKGFLLMLVAALWPVLGFLLAGKRAMERRVQQRKRGARARLISNTAIACPSVTVDSGVLVYCCCTAGELPTVGSDIQFQTRRTLCRLA